MSNIVCSLVSVVLTGLELGGPVDFCDLSLSAVAWSSPCVLLSFCKLSNNPATSNVVPGSVVLLKVEPLAVPF